MTDEAAALYWPEGTENPHEKTIQPGDNVEMVCVLHAPHVLEPGQRFNMREGGRTVATGLVTQILE